MTRREREVDLLASFTLEVLEVETKLTVLLMLCVDCEMLGTNGLIIVEGLTANLSDTDMVLPNELPYFTVSRVLLTAVAVVVVGAYLPFTMSKVWYFVKIVFSIGVLPISPVGFVSTMNVPILPSEINLEPGN